MIYYFKPYSTDGKIFEAYDEYAALVTDPEDWICFLDGDVAFLISNWGHVIQQYADKYKHAGMLVSYASRSGYTSSVPRIGDQKNTSLLFHKKIAEKLKARYARGCVVKPYNRRVSGHLMLIKKKTWDLIREDVIKRVAANNKTILGVDTQISYAVLAKGKKIHLMKAVYVLHYFRLLEGRGDKKHLLN